VSAAWLVVVVAVAAVLAAFLLRRVVFVVAALAPPRPLPEAAAEPPTVTLIVPARGEGAAVDATLDALDALAYPPPRLFVVLVDDGSPDSTGERFRAWAAARPRVRALDLPTGVGKYEALNQGLRAAPEADCVAVCDADLRPHPLWLRALVEPFADPAVGATAGFVSPANAEAGAIARYAAVESWTHQLVTSAAKDRLDLNPPTLGACAYRRTALEQAGGFGGPDPGEDLQLSAELTRAGWRIRFAAAAVADNAVVAGWDVYWHQHVRWARNVFATARGRPRSTRPPAGGLARRVESRLAATGYTDRLAVVAATALALGGLLPVWLPAAYLAVLAVEVTVAVLKAGSGRRAPVFLVTTVALFPLDVLASAAATFAHVARRPRRWRPATRKIPASTGVE
jgi:1,2-diacylglycerol 3-beta-glucosyltransferase